MLAHPVLGIGRAGDHSHARRGGKFAVIRQNQKMVAVRRLAEFGEDAFEDDGLGERVAVDALDGRGQLERDQALHADIVRGALEAFLVGGVNRAAPDLLHVALVADGAEHQAVIDLIDLALRLPRGQEQQAAVISQRHHGAAVFETVFDVFVSLLDTFVPVVRAIGRQWDTPRTSPRAPNSGREVRKGRAYLSGSPGKNGADLAAGERAAGVEITTAPARL